MRSFRGLAALGLLASLLHQCVTATPMVLPEGRLHSKRAISAAFDGRTYDFPDPSLEQAWPSDGGKWYAFATNGNGYNIQVAVADSPGGPWSIINHDALPNSGSWATGAHNWAPDVKRMPPEEDHRYIMTYSGALRGNEPFHCVGIATSNKIEGPYTPREGPVICPDIASTGGAIDSSSFYDQRNNKRYIVYKEDGNAVGLGGNCNNGVEPLHPTPIMLQEMNVNDWTTKVGGPVQILDRIDEDGPLVEAPQIIGTPDGPYVLFYSSHCFTDPKYDVKYAISDNIAGPYQRRGQLLASGAFGLQSPGGATATPQGDALLFHANCPGSSLRCMHSIDMSISGGTVTLHG